MEFFVFPPFSLLLTERDFSLKIRRRSQVVRQRSAKPLFIGSIPIAASNHNLNDTASLAGHAGNRQQVESVQKLLAGSKIEADGTSQEQER